MKRNILKTLIKEIVSEVSAVDNDALYVEYVRDIPGEEPFMLGGEKFQYVRAKYPSGKLDIGVYAFRGDMVYGYEAFRKRYNLKETVKIGL